MTPGTIVSAAGADGVVAERLAGSLLVERVGEGTRAIGRGTVETLSGRVFVLSGDYRVVDASEAVEVDRLTAIELDKYLRARIAAAVDQYWQSRPTPTFVAGKSPVSASGKVVGAPEVSAMVDASLDAWLTTGRYNAVFERKLGLFLGRKHVLTCNSGSSANLLALSALTSPLLEDRALVPGDEVLSAAASFPTTVNPAFALGLIPVLVDSELPTYNIDPSKIEAAISPRTKAIMVAHTLGNPFDLARITDIARRHRLWLVEDCCDALGSTYQGRLVGTFGDIGTLSFYPAHHITMGEGGAVFTHDDTLRRALESFRDWGRDCYCEPGRDNTCGKRFDWQLGTLPEGYDHKYTYSHAGYNLKITDMQAAVGVAQLDRLEGFIAARRKNFEYLTARLAGLREYLVLPEATPGSEPSWFGFPISIRPEVQMSRVELLRHLDRLNVGTRLLFAGNLVRQPYFSRQHYRVSGELKVADFIAENTFWIGLHPGLTEVMLDHAVASIERFIGVFDS